MPVADLVALELEAAIDAASAALKDYDHRQRASVHDGIVDALIHLKAMQRLLAESEEGGAIAD